MCSCRGRRQQLAVRVYIIPLIFQNTTCLRDIQVCHWTITQKWCVCISETLYFFSYLNNSCVSSQRADGVFHTIVLPPNQFVKVKIGGCWSLGGCLFRCSSCHPSCSISHILLLSIFPRSPSLSLTHTATVTWGNDNEGIGVNRARLRSIKLKEGQR